MQKQFYMKVLFLMYLSMLLLFLVVNLYSKVFLIDVLYSFFIASCFFELIKLLSMKGDDN